MEALNPMRDIPVPVLHHPVEMTSGRPCAYAPPPPRAQYCAPSPYSQINGQRYHNLGQAYGQSTRVPY